MAFIISGLSFAFLGVLIWLVAHYLEKKETEFNQNKRVTQAEVVGYNGIDGSAGYDLLVRIPTLSESKVYNCIAGRISTKDYPKGRVVNVCYMTRKTMGVTYTEVHLCENPPKDRIAIARGIKKFAKILIVIALFLVGCGIMSLIL